MSFFKRNNYSINKEKFQSALRDERESGKNFDLYVLTILTGISTLIFSNIDYVKELVNKSGYTIEFFKLILLILIVALFSSFLNLLISFLKNHNHAARMLTASQKANSDNFSLNLLEISIFEVRYTIYDLIEAFLFFISIFCTLATIFGLTLIFFSVV